MKLHDTVWIPTERDRAWTLLHDIPAMAACLPGARLDTVDGNRCTGRVKVKIGPLVMAYDGELELLPVGSDSVLTLRAVGRDKRGWGTAEATLQLSLEPAGPAETTCRLSVDLALTGRPAAYEQATIQEVCSRLTRQFARQLDAYLDSDSRPTDVAAREPRRRRTTVAATSVAAALLALGVVGWCSWRKRTATG